MNKPDIIGMTYGDVKPLDEWREIRSAAPMEAHNVKSFAFPLCGGGLGVDLVHSNDGDDCTLCLCCFHIVEIIYLYE